MRNTERALQGIEQWYGSLPVRTVSRGPATGTLGAALVVLERLKSEYVLKLSAHLAKGGAQIRGASGAAVKKILTGFDEHRPFSSEGGRTNRGTPTDVEKLLASLQSLKLERIAAEERNELLTAMQEFLVERVRDWHNRERLSFTFDPTRSSWELVQEILTQARESGKEGPVAQYLVGAKLQCRYPDAEVENFSYSTSDAQQGRQGDFLLGNTAFHVTVASVQPGLLEKCRTNLRDGYRVYLIVPERSWVGARQLTSDIGRIMVNSIEAFVGQNVDEMSHFHQSELVVRFRQLLTIYNQRVDAIERDKSMLIEIPPTLM